MNNQTLKIFQNINWDVFKNVKVLDLNFNDRVIAVLEIRHNKYELFNYDWYMLSAVMLTDGFEEIDSSYVFSLRTSIREDYQKFNSEFLDILHSYKYYSLNSLNKYIEIFDEYSEMLSTPYEYEELEKWFVEKQNELEYILKKYLK